MREPVLHLDRRRVGRGHVAGLESRCRRGGVSCDAAGRSSRCGGRGVQAADADQGCPSSPATCGRNVPQAHSSGSGKNLRQSPGTSAARPRWRVRAPNMPAHERRHDAGEACPLAPRALGNPKASPQASAVRGQNVSVGTIVEKASRLDGTLNRSLRCVRCGPLERGGKNCSRS
jgi:hypothetical protein